MKFRTAAALFASAAVCVAGLPAAQADPATPYVQLGVGANFTEPVVFQGTGSFASTTHADLPFNAGAMVTGAAGYAFANNLRAEFEFGWRDAPGKSLTLRTSGGSNVIFNDGGMNIYTFMVNGLYDFDLSRVTPALDRWSTHVGFGIGAASVTNDGSPTSTVFAYQPIAGIDYAVTRQLRAGIDYRYLGSSGLDLNYRQAGAAAGHTSSTLSDHAVLVTLRWSFLAP